MLKYIELIFMEQYNGLGLMEENKILETVQISVNTSAVNEAAKAIEKYYEKHKNSIPKITIKENDSEAVEDYKKSVMLHFDQIEEAMKKAEDFLLEADRIAEQQIKEGTSLDRKDQMSHLIMLSDSSCDAAIELMGAYNVKAENIKGLPDELYSTFFEILKSSMDRIFDFYPKLYSAKMFLVEPDPINDMDRVAQILQSIHAGLYDIQDSLSEDSFNGDVKFTIGESDSEIDSLSLDYDDMIDTSSEQQEELN